MYELKTEKGLKFIVISNVMYVISMIVAIVLAVLLIIGLGTAVVTGGGMSSGALTGALMFICILGLGLCIVMIIILVLQIVGLVYMYMGRDEFGQKHAEKVQLALILIIVGFIVAFIGAFIPFIGGFIALAGGFAGRLGMVFLIIEIAKDSDKMLLWVGLGLAVASSLVSLVQLSMIFVPSYSISFVFLGGIQLVVAVLGLSAWICTFIAYFRTWTGVKNGSIRPTGYGRPPPLMGAPPPPPASLYSGYR